MSSQSMTGLHCHRSLLANLSTELRDKMTHANEKVNDSQ